MTAWGAHRARRQGLSLRALQTPRRGVVSTLGPGAAQAAAAA